MLTKTNKFSIFSLSFSSSSSSSLPLETVKKISTYLITNNILFSDILKIISFNYVLILNPPSTPSSNSPSTLPISQKHFILNNKLSNKRNEEQFFLPLEFSKAAILYTINSLLQGKSGINQQILSTLITLYNQKTLPFFTSIETSQEELILTLLGQYPSCSSSIGTGIISSLEALSQANLSPLTLLEDEGNTLLHGQFTLPGFIAYLAIGALKTIKTIDVISSFSFDSLGLSTISFEAENFDTLRPHRGQITSAANIRMMLESSGNINTSSTTNPSSSSSVDLRSFLELPQVNGPTTDLINLAYK